MKLMTLDAAHDQWRRLSPRAAHLEKREADLLEAAEVTILSQAPDTVMHAAVQAEILLANVRTGERSDGLDIRAVRHLRDWLWERARRTA